MIPPRNEFELINSIRENAKMHPGLVLGIGDDTAIFETLSQKKCLITADMLMEGVHFILDERPAYLVGRKSLAVNISDIASMAGKPLLAVISIALPKSRANNFVEELYQGIFDLAEEFEISIAGGDTNTWNGPVVINVTLVGEEHPNGSVLRSGAQPGDWIMTTGAFGNSLAGRHYSFQPRVQEALRLQDEYDLHSMIDVSDGLSADLYHILEESKVGAILDASQIPIHEDVTIAQDSRNPLEHALGDGEDFELLFTLSPENGKRLLENPMFDAKVSHIGMITGKQENLIRMEDGETVPLLKTGWEHSS